LFQGYEVACKMEKSPMFHRVDIKKQKNPVDNTTVKSAKNKIMSISFNEFDIKTENPCCVVLCCVVLYCFFVCLCVFCFNSSKHCLRASFLRLFAIEVFD